MQKWMNEKNETRHADRSYLDSVLLQLVWIIRSWKQCRCVNAKLMISFFWPATEALLLVRLNSLCLKQWDQTHCVTTAETGTCTRTNDTTENLQARLFSHTNTHQILSKSPLHLPVSALSIFGTELKPLKMWGITFCMWHESVEQNVKAGLFIKLNRWTGLYNFFSFCAITACSQLIRSHKDCVTPEVMFHALILGFIPQIRDIRC